MDLREVGYDDREWINFAQDRDQWRAYCEGGNEPPGSLKASTCISLNLIKNYNKKVEIEYCHAIEPYIDTVLEVLVELPSYDMTYHELLTGPTFSPAARVSIQGGDACRLGRQSSSVCVWKAMPARPTDHNLANNGVKLETKGRRYRRLEVKIQEGTGAINDDNDDDDDDDDDDHDDDYDYLMVRPPSGPGFDSRSERVAWVRFFRGFFLTPMDEYQVTLSGDWNLTHLRHFLPPPSSFPHHPVSGFSDHSAGGLPKLLALSTGLRGM
ncbi:hypothetical protein ANN_16648 [Periplaneta americana]|uniref:Uncharacterized protein n=1 Tax=Periplaneta americana TaxID=6978 RepID=A0ABQ8SQY9_PERAM|nr:hypothetical protein ANN_16648 [Periplaneta americana]